MKKHYLNCDNCKNKGWLKSVTYGSLLIADDSEVVEKCDECDVFHNDFEAAQFAFRSEGIITIKNDTGFNVLINFSLN